MKGAAASTIARGREALLCIALLGAFGSPILLAGPAIAAPPAPPEAAAKGSLARARELFFKGVAEQPADDWEQALSHFRQSLTEAPTWRSTLNAASCLAKLGRYDEALGTYEGVLSAFAAELDPADRAKIDAAIAYLQQKLAHGKFALLWIPKVEVGYSF